MVKHIPIIILFFILAVGLLTKIDLHTADIGRHIQNGKIILTGSSVERNAVLNTNFYSYTEGDHPFINHHWGSGVIFYLIFIVSGFSGLSLFYIFLFLLAFWFFFDIARRESTMTIAVIVSFLALPVLASRTEVRPEVFSYVFSGLYFWIGWLYVKNEMREKWLWVLAVSQVVWVNLHIGFIFGPFIIGVYLIGEIVAKHWDRAKQLAMLSILLVGASLINPFGLAGVLYPFTMFGNYSYRVLENQSIPFLENLNVGNGLAFFDFKILLGLAIACLLLLLYTNYKNFIITFVLFVATFGYLGWTGIRNFPLLGLFSVSIISIGLKHIFASEKRPFAFFKNKDFQVVLLSIILVTGLIVTGLTLNAPSRAFGIGIDEGANKAAIFFKEHKIKGPIFNNYDIGGYLIYALYPAEKVFFDNRPEAYSPKFVQNNYITALEDPTIFKKIDAMYNFNVIFFYYRDYTPWGQAFITKKVFDPEWAPVFADDATIIMLKRNETNDASIKKFELPKEAFRISK